MKKTMKKTVALILASMCLLLPANSMEAQASAKYSLLGAAVEENGEITLTDNVEQSGVVRFNKKANLKKGVTISYYYKMDKGIGLDGLDERFSFADGITVLFSKKRVTNEMPRGVEMGMDGCDTSYGVEFDNYHDKILNTSDPTYRHIAVLNRDHSNHLKYKRCESMVDQQWHKVKIKANRNRIMVFHDNKKVLTQKVNMSKKMNVSIIGSSGKGYSFNRVRDVKMK